MAFPDLEFEEDSKSFTHHSNITRYLEQYAEKFDLKKHIQFETEVVDVSPANPGDKGSAWNITLLCRRSGERRVTVADLIIITGARESKPRIPEIASGFEGFQCHSSQ